MSSFPVSRLRRLRRTPDLRGLIDASLPRPEKFVWPVFVVGGTGVREPIDTIPGQNRMSADVLLQELEPVINTGVRAILVFGSVDDSEKDPHGSAARREDGAVQAAVTAVRSRYPDLIICTDVCLCAYTDHGHCGLLDSDGCVMNDATNAALAEVAVSHVAAGADVVAPSAMMDGQVATLRAGLDAAQLEHTIIMSYSTKFASSFYGPFREAGGSSPRGGDRSGHQASYADLRTALRESDLDEQEGADILMVKPALPYLDVIGHLRRRTDLPIAAYSVSGEYSMLHATADRGWGDLYAMARESITAIFRAGADIVISCWANRYSELMP